MPPQHIHRAAGLQRVAGQARVVEPHVYFALNRLRGDGAPVDHRRRIRERGGECGLPERRRDVNIVRHGIELARVRGVGRGKKITRLARVHDACDFQLNGLRHLRKIDRNRIAQRQAERAVQLLTDERALRVECARRESQRFQCRKIFGRNDEHLARRRGFIARVICCAAETCARQRLRGDDVRRGAQLCDDGIEIRDRQRGHHLEVDTDGLHCRLRHPLAGRIDEK